MWKLKGLNIIYSPTLVKSRVLSLWDYVDFDILWILMYIRLVKFGIGLLTWTDIC